MILSPRSISKQETREKILAAAKEKLTESGLLNLNTLEVARLAGVAHGTVFFHFQTRENLLVEVIDRELMKVTDELYPLMIGPQNLRELLGIYLDFLEREESFFAVIARETPFYPAELRRTIQGREAGVRSYFYTAIQSHLKSRSDVKLDITSCLNFLFGTLQYFLGYREAFGAGGSVIAEKRASLVETWMKLLD